MKLHPVEDRNAARLGDDDARPPAGAKTGKELEQAIEKETERIAELQRVLYADARYALLVVLQGRDASGKDGTIRKVFTAVNPQGCTVASFKKPTELECRHDFLWRVHQQVPARGMIGIFNRSHYEDVLVPRVHKLLAKKEWTARCRQINNFERMLTENSVIILKFMLHVSRAEQGRRLEERLTDPKKNWKFRVGDLDDRAHWDEFTKAYRGLLRRTSTEWAPWYVVPADDDDVRDWLVGRAIADRLDALDLHYPPASESITRQKID